MTERRGVIRFSPKGAGGRADGAPTGPRYAATAVAALPLGMVEPPGWPWNGNQFSVVIDLGAPGDGGWTPATIRELVEGAPGSEVLSSAGELVILEGPREVARMRLLGGRATT